MLVDHLRPVVRRGIGGFVPWQRPVAGRGNRPRSVPRICSAPDRRVLSGSANREDIGGDYATDPTLFLESKMRASSAVMEPARRRQAACGEGGEESPGPGVLRQAPPGVPAGRSQR